MYAITGVTGQVGGAMARALLAQNQSVRAIVRDAAKGKAWAALGCAVAVADMADVAALASAFAGATAVFVLPPSDFDPEPGYPEAQRVIEAVAAALTLAQPERVLCLSTIGADAPHDNLLFQRTMMERALSALPIPVTFLRPGWFLENAAWDIDAARETGVIHSFLMPLDKPFPMVSARDVGETAAGLIQEQWRGRRVVELEGPRRVSPNHLAAALADVLGTPVRAEIVPRDSWEDLFRAQGMQHPTPRIRMLDGFNEGWIAFADDGAQAIKGKVDVRDVVATFIAPRAGR